MSRYIDAEQIQYFDMMYPCICKANSYEEARVITKTEHNITRKEYIDEVPTADVQEVKHGIWSEYADTDFEGNLFDTFTCSCCNNVLYHNYNFCPNCGAKMDGGEDK